MAMATSLLRLNAGPSAGWTVVTASGELDCATRTELDAQLEAVIVSQPHPRVAVDLSRLGFFDAAGLCSLVMAWKRAQRRGGELLLLRPPREVRRKLEVTRLAVKLRVVEELPGHDQSGR